MNISSVSDNRSFIENDPSFEKLFR